MRAQALKLLQRLPGAFAAQDGSHALRFLSSNTGVLGDSSLLQIVHGKKQEQGSFGSAQMRLPSLSFASQMHSLASKDDSNDNQVAGRTGPMEVKEVPKIPTAMSLLPVKSQRAAMPPAQRAYAAAAAAGADDHHGPYWVNHPYHVLPPSPWPLLGGWGAGVACLGMSAFFHAMPGGTALMLTGIGSVAMTAMAWWRDCIIESDMGMHTEVVKRNLMSGIWIFIVSEAALFFGLLWSCVHLGMAPNVNVQMQWPPVGIEAVGWDKRALVMSAVLAASYYSANVAMVAKNPQVVMGALATTLGLGVLFLGDQYLEYSTAPFTITDGPYGTTFFLTTGFHGMHVFLGACWLAVAMKMYPRYNNPGVGMRGSILYWHFVDIVWIAVYGIIYVAQL